MAGPSEGFCPACERALKIGLTDWHRACQGCTYEGSTLLVDIDTAGDREVLDEALREEALGSLRKTNFATLAAQLAEKVAQQGSRRRTLLDVGCAHGWFLEAASVDFDVLGIEPDARIAELARDRGLAVRRGFFPDVLKEDERFDVIIFNDVLEHIPDILGALTACSRHLRPGGLVVVNAPARTGFLYRISKLMIRLGLPATFERMWQKSFPSPHVHYLDDQSIRAIGQRAGLRLDGIASLPSVSAKGLYARIRYDRSVPAYKALTVAAVLTLLTPWLKALPADIKVWTFRSRDPERPRAL